MNRIKLEKGFVSIPLLIALSALIIAVGVGVTSISFNENTISAVVADGNKALRYAEGGAKDALMKIARNPFFTDTTGNYKINFASPTGSCASSIDGCAQIKVHAPPTLTPPVTWPEIITVTGKSGSAIRKIQVDVAYTSALQISNTYWAEIKTLPTISTGQATSIAATTANLNGWTNPNNNSTNVWFRYNTTRPSVCTDDTGVWSGSVRAPTSGYIGSAKTGTDPVFFGPTATSTLVTATTYYYCAMATDGTNTVYGQVFSFTTL